MATHCLQTAWTQHAAELRSWLLHRLRQPQDVDDLMQELFLKALRQGDLFCEVRHARAWLFQVARHMLADHFRELAPPLEWSEGLDELPADVEQADVVDELTICLPRVLSELSPTDREAIVCCDLEGLPQAEYAARVGLGLSAAKSRLQRARQRLRAHMTAACQVQFDRAGHIEDFVPRSTPPQKQ